VKITSVSLSRFPTLALVVGLLSGLLTAACSRLVDPLNPFLGIIFGAAITLLIWFRYRRLTVPIAVATLSSSVTAYLAAVWVSIWTVGAVTSAIHLHEVEPAGLWTFSFAGFLGALIITLTLLLLLSPQRSWRVFGRAIAWSVAGGWLGLISSAMSEAIGSAVGSILGYPQLGLGRHYAKPFYSAYLVWQTGIAFLIPLILPQSLSTDREKSVSIQSRSAQI
jgi:hypothetical protein